VDEGDPVDDEGVYVADADDALVHVDAAGLRLLGYGSLEELRGRDAHATLHARRPDGAAFPADECGLHDVGRRGRALAAVEACFARRDGSLIAVACTALPIPVGEGTGSVVHFRPTAAVTTPDEAEHRAGRAEVLRRALLAHIPDTAVFLIDHDLRILAAEGEAVQRMTWLERAVSERWLVTDLARVPAETLTEVVENYRAVLRGERRTFEASVEGATFAVQAVPVHAADGSVEAAVVMARDVSTWADARTTLARRARQQEVVAELGRFALEARDQLELVERMLASVVETLGARGGAVLELDESSANLTVVALTGLEGFIARGDRVRYDERTSPAGHALRTGRPLIMDETTARTRFDLYPPFVAVGLDSAIVVPLVVRQRPYGAMVVHDWAERTFTQDDATFVSAITTLVAVAVERQSAEAATLHAALHDALTGLPNRALALDRLEHALAWRKRDGIDVAVLMLDLDRFKIINDSFGHAAGDEALVTMGPRLRAAVRPTDTLGRIGGDEFVVVCPGADAADAVGIAERLGLAASRPLALRGGDHFFSVSTGIAVASGTQDTADSLMRDADAALYRAKELGRGRHELFDAAMRARVVARLGIERELRLALERDELEVWYQPVIDLASGRPVATEALVRWHHPERGIVPPADFIPIAEEIGLITQLGLIVLEQACAQTARWQRHGSPFGVSVNVSGRQLLNPAFPGQVEAIAGAAGLARGSLTLEITETVLMDESEGPVGLLTELRALGMSLSIDDFGTGHSSMSRLKAFPLDSLKVDRAFVAGVATGSEDRALVQATIDMAHALGMTVVAEGVETAEQRDVLRELGCDRVQGYLYMPPRPAHELMDLAVLRPDG
jgi:diguanylate cyclase (GGDEF)-like protein